MRSDRYKLVMNALSRREEETLLKKTKESALKECDPVVKGEETPAFVNLALYNRHCFRICSVC